MKMYEELADWWPILSRPEDYAEEAGVYADAIALHARREVRDVLELGSGGGNNASHYKQRFDDLTLVDLSPRMLEVSKLLNPECEHIVGDMRDVRLGRTFDAVLAQDAIMYMTTEADLAAAIATGAEHLAPGGIALFVPDDTTQTYEPETSHGGHDDGQRSLRYLQWSGPLRDNTFEALFVYVLREGDREWIESERHTWGLFSTQTWVRLIEAAGLEAKVLPYPHSDFDGEHQMFAGIKPG